MSNHTPQCLSGGCNYLANITAAINNNIYLDTAAANGRGDKFVSINSSATPKADIIYDNAAFDYCSNANTIDTADGGNAERANTGDNHRSQRYWH